MTKLQEQLQQWANEGRYIFPTDNNKGVFLANAQEQDGYYKCNENGVYEPIEEIAYLVELVLDGVIPVWRPVEHYDPQEKLILCLGRGVMIGRVEKRDGAFWLPTPESTYTNVELVLDGVIPVWRPVLAVKITHWMPLPQAPNERE